MRVSAAWLRNRTVPKKAPRQRRGSMNGAEAAFSLRLKADPLVARFVFEGVSFRLANGARFTPDFIVFMVDGSIQIHEIKGSHSREAAIVRLKVAAGLFPEFQFFIQRLANGRWAESRIYP